MQTSQVADVVVTSVALELHTDLQAIKNYANNPALLCELVVEAEKKLADIQAMLQDVRVIANIKRVISLDAHRTA